jgi:hypothetical protein
MIKQDPKEAASDDDWEEVDAEDDDNTESFE